MNYILYYSCIGLIHFTNTVASAPTNLSAVQEGFTSVRVSWSPPTPLGNTTGYRIYYGRDISDSVDVSGGSTDNHLVTGFQIGTLYNITLVGTSQQLPSEGIEIAIKLGEFGCTQ